MKICITKLIQTTAAILIVSAGLTTADQAATITPYTGNTTFFTTSTPKMISGFNLVVNNIADGSRSAAQFQLFAGGNLIDTVNILSPGRRVPGGKQ